MKRAIYTVAFLFFLGAWTGHKGIIQEPSEPSAMLAATPASTEAPAPTADAQTGFSDKEMVDRHNHWRSEVGAPNLRWSESLTAHAQEWADELASLGCNMVHRDQDQYGENLTRFAPRRSSSGQRSLQTVTPTQVVDGWADEKQWYSHGANRCQAGQVCGHYTQVVWSSTREVGCAKAVCADQSQIWVCNYDPQGNIAGQKPY